MMISQKQLNNYFKRIAYTPIIGHYPNLQTLTALQVRHAYNIPFENLNPLLNIPTLLDFATLYSKLVNDKRGGYCYEQNLFFMFVLQELGFNVRGISAKVSSSNDFSRRTHMLLLVQIKNEEYIVDVGFGSIAPCTPLLLHNPEVQVTNYGKYKLIYDGDNNYTLYSLYNNNHRSLYRFDLQEQSIKDFDVGNWYTSTNYDAHFKNNLIVSLRTEQGRCTLNDNIFTTYYLNGNKKNVTIQSIEEMKQLLKIKFKLKLNNLPGLDQKLKKFIEK